ncbi:LacI family transcriptional regulator [Actinomadura sp. ATCC 31491]|uniref:LacI family transcriptional regulator n=1 Tax=Actinomadura luzonensis TaxID=2805427 RepID=A0ABT0G2C7_9ACTN|nr:LacI family DNA-binding transcriptional regulator [Actinomadura luzonensis]MCK2218692.1 LacI family transcriptional regulator [Actinomadura luzonensis]
MPRARFVPRQAVAATGYVPNRAARSLVTRRTGTIALVVSGAGDEDETGRFPGQVLTDPFFGRVVGGIVGFLRPRGVHPLLMLAETADTRAQVLAHLRQGDADGAVLVSTHADDPLPSLLAEARLPAVLFARPARPVPISYVDVDHRAGAKLAADHLLAQGRHDLVTISGPLDVPAGQARLAGFQDALAVLRHHGRTVPGDVAVVGFDDSSAATACRPPLTTVRHPVEDMAAELARLLLRHIERPDHPPTSVIFEPSLVVRGSA